MSTAKKSTKRNARPKTTKPMTKVSASEQGYDVHKEGSRKGKVHQLFNKEGPEAAWVLGLKLKLKEGTLRSWFAAWKRLQSKSQGEVKTNSATLAAVAPDAHTAPSEVAHPQVSLLAIASYTVADRFF
jgi:hypothetical protein